MKNTFKYFTLILAMAVGISCSRDNYLPEPVQNSGVIMVDVSSKSHTKLTESDLESKGVEAYVTHIDLYIFGEQAAEDGQVAENVYHERISYSDPTSPETRTLEIKKDLFKSSVEYDVYVIANTTLSESQMAAVASVSDLSLLAQEDKNIHLTGLNLENVPELFLMDASLDVILNPAGKETENIVLDIKLTRAAAKVVVELFEGSSEVQFQAPDNAHVYHIRNLPYSSSLLPSTHTPSVRSTESESSNGYVAWNADNTGVLDLTTTPVTVTGTPQISITGYVYSYDYSALDMDRQTSLVVNIPLKITDGGTEKDYPTNYYKIPLTNKLKFERNRMYRIRANVNAPGAQTSFDPMELTGLQYDVIDWNDNGPQISVGAVQNKPSYLHLTQDHVDMYNVNTEENAIQFATSSYITSIVLVEAYYKNSTDQVVYLNSSSASDDRTVYSQIKANYPAAALNGDITIFSPFVADASAGIANSHKNTIRYLTFEVTNGDGLKERFTVAQYPTLYITNEHGMYSYREDFLAKNALSVSWNNSAWQYYSSSRDGGFFASKVAVSSGSGYSIRYASRWSSDGTMLEASSSSLSMFNNPRMYHIHVTATSADYIVAKPRIDENQYTEMTADNSRLVSPSFMIASQLGATETNGGSSGVDIEKAKRHCKEYVEVSGGKTYKDWRLPTKAEIDIIEKHQHSSPAMAEVLNGSHYYCAYNPEYEEYTDPSNRYYNERKDWIYTVRDIGSSGSVHVRCVHDSYE